jgi:lysophospholipase L1-like esterase
MNAPCQELDIEPSEGAYRGTLTKDKPMKLTAILQGVAAIALAGAVAAMTWAELPQPSGTIAPAASRIYNWNPTQHQPTLLVIGDSYAQGAYDETVTAYPSRIGEKMGWHILIDASGGTGFIKEVTTGLKPGEPIHRSLPARLKGDRKLPPPEFILIDAGRNDFGQDTEEFATVATRYINDVHAMWPNSAIVIAYPSYATPDIAPQYPEFSATLRQAAGNVGAYLIDPVGLGWYRNINLAPLLWKDHIHLNSPGQDYYADRMVDNLKQWFTPWRSGGTN